MVAAAPTGGRTAAAQQLAADWTAGSLKISEAVDYAHELVECAAGGTAFRDTGAVPASVDATAFAGAVLDACTLVSTSLPRDDNATIFWMKMGRLAFRAAEEAHAAGRLPESLSLAFAGPERWQTEAYWRRSPDHDALAAVILAKSGRRGEAISRLQSRGGAGGAGRGGVSDADERAVTWLMPSSC